MSGPQNEIRSRAAALYGEIPAGDGMKVLLAHYSDRGTRRAVNEDALVIRTADTVRGVLVMAAVCDGMGGRSRGELASATAVTELSGWFEERLPLLLRDGYDFAVLRAGIEFIIRRISSLLENYGRQNNVTIGSTLTMLLLYNGHCVTANVGDSRIYALGGGARQLTRDHTLVQQEIDRGLLQPSQAETDKRRNVLTQCLGETASLAPDIIEQDVPPGTVFLLCSDGFRHCLAPQEMEEKLSAAAEVGSKALEDALSALARCAMARGETDNITAAAVRAT